MLNFLIYYPFIFLKNACSVTVFICMYLFRYCLFKNHHLEAFLIETFDDSDVPVYKMFRHILPCMAM